MSPATSRRRAGAAREETAAAARRTLETRAEDLDRPHDPGYEIAAERAVGLPDDVASEPIEVRTNGGRGPGLVRVGTASWTDPTMTAAGVFYPSAADTAEERLAYYASRFPVVEVDATYYALPQRRTAELWVERTPPDFTFDVKAHALLTGQGTETRRLPKALRESLPDGLSSKPRVYLKDLPAELAGEVWRAFADGVEPLREHGQLGAIFLQYPKWFFTSSENRDAIREAKGRLGELGLPVAVEFRNASWFNEKNIERTLRFLEDEHVPLVMVDAPQGTKSSVPPIVAAPSPDLAVVRFHGRRAATWEASGVTPVERFRYLYDERELEEWVPRIREAAAQARETHVLMNNCYGNYGATNALELAALLRDLDVDD
ncbi:MAG TPA: DUF72 domain-containing protein [Candidatus Limnocylindrales bacterium]